jgi:hypothetical protein
MPERLRLKPLLGAAAPIAVLGLLLALPDRLPLDPVRLLRPPLELPALVLLIVAFPWRGVRAAATALLLLMAALKLADLGTRAAYLRPFNPVFDGDLIPAAWRRISGVAGWPQALGRWPARRSSASPPPRTC